MSLESSLPMLDGAAAKIDHATEQARSAAQRGLASVRDSSQQMMDRAHRASETTTTYIRGEPVKAMLMAAAAGAALMALVSLVTRSRDRD